MSDAGVTPDGRRLVVGPFNRVEGDLEVSLDIVDGRVRAAYVNSPLYRGFENLLVGRPTTDALVLVPRICGICSVSQSAAAVAALEDLSGLRPPKNGRLARNLILASEVLVDHLTHFYLFFMPDFARDAYAGQPWSAVAKSRFAAMTGAACKDFLPARARFLSLLGTLAGKWPHTLALRPGGTTRPLQGGERARLLAVVREFRGFVERVFLGDRLEALTALPTIDHVRDWAGGRDADFPRWFGWANGLGLAAVGDVPGVSWLSSGAYPAAAQGDGALFAAGVWSDGAAGAEFDPRAITEDLTRARLRGASPLSPARGVTDPDIDKTDAYTWCKAPRYAGKVAETGALARQLVDGQPLLQSLVRAHGGSVVARVLARAVEVARLLPAMEDWLKSIDEHAPYLAAGGLPAAGEAVGCVEAARGTLAHWLTVDGGAIRRYQIVAPTTWNFSPRDQHGIPGALEQSLTGITVDPAERAPVLVQHVVRSFDPCMVCTVH